MQFQSRPQTKTAIHAVTMFIFLIWAIGSSHTMAATFTVQGDKVLFKAYGITLSLVKDDIPGVFVVAAGCLLPPYVNASIDAILNSSHDQECLHKSELSPQFLVQFYIMPNYAGSIERTARLNLMPFLGVVNRRDMPVYGPEAIRVGVWPETPSSGSARCPTPAPDSVFTQSASLFASSAIPNSPMSTENVYYKILPDQAGLQKPNASDDLFVDCFKTGNRHACSFCDRTEDRRVQIDFQWDANDYSQNMWPTLINRFFQVSNTLIPQYKDLFK